MLPADWRLPVVIAAAITDGVDGQLSRLMGAQSKLGVLLDPIADKVFFLAVVATLLWDGNDMQGRSLPPGMYFIDARWGGATVRGRIVRL